MNSDYFLYTHAWYQSGRRGRHGGFIAEYIVCNDTYSPDDEDHDDVLEELKEEGQRYGGEELWPDEFHKSAKLEIRVDPLKRIEFIYTPEATTAMQRHASKSKVVREGVERHYENNALSIRIDLDPTAPNGVALDVGRSEYDGQREGQHMVRSADLLGSVLSRTSETGSHEYAGFTEAMAEQFMTFAEQLSVQLSLQHDEYQEVLKQHQKLGHSTLRVAS